MPIITYIVAVIVALLLMLMGQYSGAATVVLLSLILVKLGNIEDLLRSRNHAASKLPGAAGGGERTASVKVRE